MEYTSLKVIPMPKEVVGADAEGNFEYISFVPEIIVENGLEIYAEGFSDILKKVHGIELKKGEGGIRVTLDPTLGKGTYTVDVGETINVVGGDSDGINYAFATLVQLMTPEMTLPRVRISDKPDSEYRSFMLDVARQWHDFEVLLKYVDLCFLYKVKFFHIHFIDHQSYTLPSKVLPNLSTEDRHYTFEEIKTLNEYAFARGVEIVPK